MAMGRAIVRKPKVFLMDEPLSNLDAKLRVQMINSLSSISRLKSFTASKPLGYFLQIFFNDKLDIFSFPPDI